MAISEQALTRRTLRLAAAGLGCALALAACGSSGAGPAAPAAHSAAASANASAAAAACPHLTSLRASLTNLTGLQISPASAARLSADIANIERQMSSLKSLGESAGASDAARLAAALRKITLAAQAEIGRPTQANLTALRSALTGMKDTARPMIQQLKSVCPDASG
jgi:hypothetical protein